MIKEKIKGKIVDREQEIAEGTCGYGIDGELGDEPAGSHLLKKFDLRESVFKRLQKLANIIVKEEKVCTLKMLVGAKMLTKNLIEVKEDK